MENKLPLVNGPLCVRHCEELAKDPIIEYRDNEDMCSEYALRFGHGIGAHGSGLRPITHTARIRRSTELSEQYPSRRSSGGVPTTSALILTHQWLHGVTWAHEGRCRGQHARKGDSWMPPSMQALLQLITLTPATMSVLERK